MSGRLRGSIGMRAARQPLALRPALRMEPLESRALLSASSALDAIMAQPMVANLAATTNTTPVGYSPSQITSAYGFNQISFSGGAANGSGQTIAIVDAYDDPNIAADLHTFDQKLGLADPSFTKINQNGGGSMPQADAGWSEEIALDVEWAHAVAPGAKIVLVEANSSSLTDLMAAVNTARNLAGVSVVSMSWGASEFRGETQLDQYFTTPTGHTGVTFVASAGDSSAAVLWPSASPNVLSVGGTSLNVSGTSYSSESAWIDGGGGVSRLESEPSYQSGVQSTGARTTPDVAYDANPSTGVAVYDSVATGGRGGWMEIGGTSAGAPQWAALFAIADQGRALKGEAPLASGQSAIYALSSSDFHDVTTGTNGFSATAGYDLATGRGSPIANLVVNALVSGTTSGSSGSSGSTSGSSGSSGTGTSNPPSQSPPTQSHGHHYWELIYYHGHLILIELFTPNAVGSGDSGDDSASNLAPAANALVASMSAATSTATSAISTASFTTLSTPAAPVGTPDVQMPLLVTSTFSVGAGMVVAEEDAPPESSPREKSQTPQPTPAETGTADANTVVTASRASVGALAVGSAASSAQSAVLDACFADDGWLAPLGDTLGGAAANLADNCELDLTVLAVALALSVHRRRTIDDEEPTALFRRARRMAEPEPVR